MTTRIKFYSGDIVSSVSDGGVWRVEARDPAKLRATLGDVLLIPFAELFVWADRLAAIAQHLHLDSLHVPRESLAAGRNGVTLVAYAVGVIYEASGAILKLRRAGVARLIPYSTHWTELDDLRKRWQRLPLSDLRNKIAFHADPDKIRAGLDRFIRKHRRLPLVEGDGPKRMHSSNSLGPRLLHAGLRYTRRDLRRVSQQITADSGALGDLGEHVLLEVLNAKGFMKPF